MDTLSGIGDTNVLGVFLIEDEEVVVLREDLRNLLLCFAFGHLYSGTGQVAVLVGLIHFAALGTPAQSFLVHLLKVPVIALGAVEPLGSHFAFQTPFEVLGAQPASIAQHLVPFHALLTLLVLVVVLALLTSDGGFGVAWAGQALCVLEEAWKDRGIGSSYNPFLQVLHDLVPSHYAQLVLHEKHS